MTAKIMYLQAYKKSVSYTHLVLGGGPGILDFALYTFHIQSEGQPVLLFPSVLRGRLQGDVDRFALVNRTVQRSRFVAAELQRCSCLLYTSTTQLKGCCQRHRTSHGVHAEGEAHTNTGGKSAAYGENLPLLLFGVIAAVSYTHLDFF